MSQLQRKLLDLLENTNIPKTPYPRNTKVGNGYSVNFGAGKRPFQSNAEFKANKQFPELFKTIVEYGNSILPTGFEYEIITVNRNLKAKKHTDGGNNGVGFITFLGDYTGGGLYIYENGKPVLYDTHNVLIGFNGSIFPHKTQPFKGNRYSIAFYKHTGLKTKGVNMVGSGLKIV